MWCIQKGTIAFFLFASILSAQSFRATVVGRVTDDTGAVVPGAMITITNVGTNENRSVVVNERGEYAIPQLAPGQYTLTAEYTGFNKVVRSGIVLETNQDARFDIVLKVGGITEEVQVSAAAPLVTTENASLGNVVDQRKIVELPLNGRDYLQLAFMQPNVFATAQGSNLGFRGGLNVAGNSEIANQYILDGVDNNDETTNQPLHRPILDAVREFKILTGTYSAEYGRQAGGQIMVTTQSGTNAFHSPSGNSIAIPHWTLGTSLRRRNPDSAAINSAAFWVDRSRKTRRSSSPRTRDSAAASRRPASLQYHHRPSRMGISVRWRPRSRIR